MAKLYKVVISVKCVIKDDGKFYRRLFLDHILYDEQVRKKEIKPTFTDKN